MIPEPGNLEIREPDAGSGKELALDAGARLLSAGCMVVGCDAKADGRRCGGCAAGACGSVGGFQRECHRSASRIGQDDLTHAVGAIEVIANMPA